MRRIIFVRMFAMNLKTNDMDYDQISNCEFGMDYDQLGPNEQEWVRDEYDNQ